MRLPVALVSEELVRELEKSSSETNWWADNKHKERPRIPFERATCLVSLLKDLRGIFYLRSVGSAWANQKWALFQCMNCLQILISAESSEKALCIHRRAQSVA